MAPPLRVLVLEDNPSDAYLMLSALGRARLNPLFYLVETEQEFRNHLVPAPDVVLADYSLPEFSALDALRILREQKLDIPCIVVSGFNDAEREAEIRQEGGFDYVLKNDMGRLGQAVKLALQGRTALATGDENGLMAADDFGVDAAFIEPAWDTRMNGFVEGPRAEPLVSLPRARWRWPLRAFRRLLHQEK